MPAAEAAFHPSDKNDVHELYLMCNDLKTMMQSLKGKKAKCGPVQEVRWGTLTTVSLPGGGKIGLYSQSIQRQLAAKLESRGWRTRFSMPSAFLS